ncbi:nuclear transport factor 2 family protein [Flagellimonas sp. HMM57]|uniref:nuclear transport factor 2 family protein n=2 Tax=unclassified Flagellimonas TaxID=2644544 RepID=UPI001F3D149C|nr:nuclear transport factor 2 family protein [Flagellimonas sp. HMM57]UII75160.1 nuclear transport factor 2 family protein [Flagellimonas sp. HMM57]
MKRLSMVLLTMICFSSTSCKSQIQNNSIKMEKEIKSVIETFVKAGEERNVAMYNDILHENFRVIANKYPTSDKISIIPAEGYKALITKEVIGGTKYEVVFKSIDIAEHSATVIAELKAEKGGQSVTFLLVQNTENEWQIITDMATQKK